VILLVCGGTALVALLPAPGAVNTGSEVEDAGSGNADDSNTDAGLSPETAGPAARGVYKYSVIPGGAYDAQELRAAVDRDPVIAAAYQTLADEGMHNDILPADRLAYISYRIDDRIYWTKHRVQLHRGETILTNGTTELRGRCGNQISVDPMLPTRDAEPTAMELEALIVPEPAVLDSRALSFDSIKGGALLGFNPIGGWASMTGGAPLGWIPPSESSGTELDGPLPIAPDSPFDYLPPTFIDELPPTAAVGGPSAPPHGSVGFSLVTDTPSDHQPPTILVNIPGGLNPTTGDDAIGCEQLGAGCGGPTPDNPPAPVPTPEPGTLLLIGSGLAGAAARKLRSRRSHDI
jgi:PEP-CTERM motif-containing protein